MAFILRAQELLRSFTQGRAQSDLYLRKPDAEVLLERVKLEPDRSARRLPQGAQMRRWCLRPRKWQLQGRKGFSKGVRVPAAGYIEVLALTNESKCVSDSPERSPKLRSPWERIRPSYQPWQQLALG